MNISLGIALIIAVGIIIFFIISSSKEFLSATRIIGLPTIEAIGSAATAAALFFLWRQSNQTQQEIDSTLRAWLGISHIYINVVPGKLLVYIKNHGRVLGRIVKVQQNELTAKNITEEEVQKGTADFSHDITIFPNIETYFELQDKTSAANPYVGILITYEYGTNKTGKYGLIAIHDPAKPGYDSKKPELKYVKIFTK